MIYFSKMKVVHSPEQLLQTFKNQLETKEFGEIEIRVSPQSGKFQEIRVEAQNQKIHFPVQLDLYPSRKVLEKTPENEARPFLLAVHIPEDLAQDYRRHGINHADLNGRLYIKSPYVLLDREPRRKEFRGPVTEADWFSLKSSRLLRTLLSHPDRDWSQAELIESTRISGGLASRIVNAMHNEGFLSKLSTVRSRNPARYTVKESDRLLALWQQKDVWKKRVHIQEYSVLRGDLEEVARTVQDGLGEENLAFTQWFAANLRYPYTTPPVVSAYVRKERLPEIKFGRKVAVGGNLWLLYPEDEGVFFETRKVNGYRLVTDIQIYLDLLQVGQRGPEQAEALRVWEGFNR